MKKPSRLQDLVATACASGGILAGLKNGQRASGMECPHG